MNVMRMQYILFSLNHSFKGCNACVREGSTELQRFFVRSPVPNPESQHSPRVDFTLALFKALQKLLPMRNVLDVLLKFPRTLMIG